MEKAFFVRYPRTYEDLMQLHLVRREQLFEIVYTVELSGIEYENFLYGWMQIGSLLRITPICVQMEP